MGDFMEVSLDGGCLCGAVRYHFARLRDAGYCHCRLCQRSSGAPVLAWATVPIDQFCYTKGAPRAFRSSERGMREFCATCGTQVTFRRLEGPSTVDVNIATLDEPGAVEPEYHIWVASRLPWFETRDDLPRYMDDGPDADS